MKYTVKSTVVFEFESDVAPKVIADSFRSVVEMRMRDVFFSVSGFPVATRVFDENGDYITEV